MAEPHSRHPQGQIVGIRWSSLGFADVFHYDRPRDTCPAGVNSTGVMLDARYR